MIRAQGNLDNIKLLEPIKMDETLLTKLEPPRFVNGRTLLIAGLSERYTAETSAGIPAQSQRFSPYLGNIPGQAGRTAYGVICNTDDAGNTEYICGVEVSDFSRVSPELSRLRIPEQRYAVFHTAITLRRFDAPGSLFGISGCRNREMRWLTVRHSSSMAKISTPRPERAVSRFGCPLRSEAHRERERQISVVRKRSLA